MSIDLTPNGELVVGTGFSKIRRIDQSGRIYTVIGTGSPGSTGDGGPATGATVWAPTGVAVGDDGSIIFADAAIVDRVRRIGPDGVVTALMGSGTATEDLGPAPSASMDEPHGLAIGPEGNIYLGHRRRTAPFDELLRKVTPPLPGLSDAADIVIASADGSEVYVFTPLGRHLRTVDALTGVVIYEFDYVDQADIAGGVPAEFEGYLKSITDRDGNITLFDRDAVGNVTVTGPFGQETVITLDANGYLQSIQNPGGETTNFEYEGDGLLSKVTDPRANPTNYTYTTDGRLETTLDPVGGGHTLTRTELANGFQVLAETAEGVQTNYEVEFQSTGDELRTTSFADGTERTTLTGIDESTTVSEPDGTMQVSQPGPDPRFGMQAAIPASTEISTPGGLVADIEATSDATITNPADPLSLATQQDTVAVNGRTVTRTYNAAANTFTDTTPEGRQTVTTLNSEGRVEKTELTGVYPTRQEYDAQGRVTRVIEGPDPDPMEIARITEFDYVDVIDISNGYPPESEGQLKSVTDALSPGRTVTFEYDTNGRVSKQILPDGREIGFQYDDAGNVTQVIPPGRPAHDFTYTGVNLEQSYDPPQVSPPLATVTTTTTYTDDGQVDLITRPDGKQIDFAYDASGRVDTITLQPSGEVRDYTYDDSNTGNLLQIAAADATIDFGYDGSLQTTETWTGPEIATASVTRTYDDSLRVESLQVNGETPVQYVYDDDDLLVQAGNLTLVRDPDNGLLTGTTITEGAGTVADTYEYNEFGELKHYEVTHNGVEMLDFDYTRDDLGRISSIVETKNTTGTPVVKASHYKYDDAGRLWLVCDDDVCATIRSQYLYDDNGNRIAGTFNAQGTITSAVYDDQDRLLEITHGPTTTTYTYTDNGELLTKTDPSGTTSYEYDQLGNLTKVTPPTGLVIEYLIDAHNRRTGRVVNGVVEEQLVYKDDLNPIGKLDVAEVQLSEFVYAVKGNTPSLIIRHDDPMPGSTTTYRVVSDHLGSVRLVWGIDSADPQMAEDLMYDEFGISSSSLTFQPFAFAGGIWNSPDSDFLRFGARDYDPKSGRWTAKDPIGFSV